MFETTFSLCNSEVASFVPQRKGSRLGADNLLGEQGKLPQTGLIFQATGGQGSTRFCRSDEATIQKNGSDFPARRAHRASTGAHAPTSIRRCKIIVQFSARVGAKSSILWRTFRHSVLVGPYRFARSFGCRLHSCRCFALRTGSGRAARLGVDRSRRSVRLDDAPAWIVSRRCDVLRQSGSTQHFPDGNQAKFDGMTGSLTTPENREPEYFGSAGPEVGAFPVFPRHLGGFCGSPDALLLSEGS
jgi:hypothetical protein